MVVCGSELFVGVWIFYFICDILVMEVDGFFCIVVILVCLVWVGCYDFWILEKVWEIFIDFDIMDVLVWFRDFELGMIICLVIKDKWGWVFVGFGVWIFEVYKWCFNFFYEI